MTTWLLSRSELTPDQIRAIELRHDQHQVIFGPPGSGKTQVLLHRAADLRQRIDSAAARFRIFVYTNVLKAYIRSALDLLDLPESSVTTFDDWCKRFHERYISPQIPWDEVAGRPDFDAIRRAVAQAVVANRVELPLYDFVLVDEGQDLHPDAFDILRRIAKHVTVCLDQKQQIFDRGSTENDILAALGLRRRNIALLDAYRCSPCVARLASQFLDDPVEQQYYLQQIRTEQIDRELPLYYEAISFEDEQKRLVEVLIQRMLIDQRIGVLFPLRRQVFQFAKVLHSFGIEAEPQGDLNFSSSRPKVVTLHSAKGLTFDTVLLPRLVTRSFPVMVEERIRRLLFVAITRATRWVYLSATRDDALPLLATLKPLVTERALSIQQGGQFSRGTVSVTSGQSSELDFL